MQLLQGSGINMEEIMVLNKKKERQIKKTTFFVVVPEIIH